MKSRSALLTLTVGLLGIGGVVVAPAVQAAEPFDALKASLASCTTPMTVTVTADITEPTGSLSIGCNATVDLSGHALKLNSIDISAGKTLIIEANGGGDLTLTPGSDGVPGIRTTGATLVIDGGVIDARGGRHAAGIGGGNRETGGTVTINGGDVTAIGNVAAGIGGGDYGDSGSITINGGSVEGRGDGGDSNETSGAGIGAGRFRTGSATITGGTVVAQGGRSAAGIGGGQSGNAGVIAITGGTVDSYAGADAAAIGGGDNLQRDDGLGNGGTVTIGPGAVVSAYGGYTAIGSTNRGADFGSLQVDGTLKLANSSLRIADSNPSGAEVSVGSGGKVLGSDTDPVTSGNISGNANYGTGQIDNDGIIALDPSKVGVEVRGHSYAITYDANGGTPATATVLYATSLAAGYRSLPTPTWTDHTLTGWATTPGGGTAFTDETPVSGAQTLYAQWVSNTITLATPSITGTARVGDTLLAVPGAVTPSDADVTYTWTAGDTQVGTGSTYVVGPDDLTRQVTLTQTATKPNYPTASRTSAATTPVVQGTMTMTGSIAVTGTLEVGQTLTATSTVATVPAADVAGQWYRDTTPIQDATSSTYQLTSDDLGAQLSYQETRALSGYVDVTSASNPTDPVAEGTMTTTGTVEITGTAKVGQTLTATSTVTTVPATGLVAGQWYRDGVEVDGATETTYRLTNDDVSAQLSYRETRTLAGYHDVVQTAPVSERITGGIIDLAVPTIAGTAVVDQLLTARPGAVVPAAATVTLTWRVDGTPVHTGESYQIRPTDLGLPITVTAAATRTDYDPVAAESAPTAEVRAATFNQGPSASISGVFKVGEELIAHEGTPVPAQDSYLYQWLADGDEITGAIESTYTLTMAHKDARISVRVTALRAGYDTAADTSTQSAVVVTNLAPDLTLRATSAHLRLGESTDLTWTSGDAITIDSSGAWSGPKPLSGQQRVTPAAVGTGVYQLEATNGSGTTTAQVSLDVALPPTSLHVTSRRSALAPGKVKIKARGLAAAERYTILIGKTPVATGKAKATGRIARKIAIPRSVKAGQRMIHVIGSLPDRTGARRLKVVRTKPLTLTMATTVRASDSQHLTVRHLRPQEKVRIRYRGKRISPDSAKADKGGVYSISFNVGMAWGTYAVTATGRLDGRSTTRRFSVVKRCVGTTHRCL